MSLEALVTLEDLYVSRDKTRLNTSRYQASSVPSRRYVSIRAPS